MEKQVNTRFKQARLAEFIEWSSDIEGQEAKIKDAIATLSGDLFETLSNEAYTELADDLRAGIIRQDNEANKGAALATEIKLVNYFILYA